MSTESLVAEYRQSLSPEEGERLCPGGVENPIATELKEFADAARGPGVPEVDGLEGYRSQAICMAVLESEWFKRPVTLAEIDQALGID